MELIAKANQQATKARQTMNPIPQAIWNKIAYRRTLKSWWGEVMLNIEEEEEAQGIQEKVSKELHSKGYSSATILAYQTVLPLLLESKAITDYVTVHPQYREALPEILNQREAIELAKLEWRNMTQKDLEMLLQLLPEKMEPIVLLWSPAIREFAEKHNRKRTNLA